MALRAVRGALHGSESHARRCSTADRELPHERRADQFLGRAAVRSRLSQLRCVRGRAAFELAAGTLPGPVRRSLSGPGVSAGVRGAGRRLGGAGEPAGGTAGGPIGRRPAQHVAASGRQVVRRRRGLFPGRRVCGQSASSADPRDPARTAPAAALAVAAAGRHGRQDAGPGSRCRDRQLRRLRSGIRRRRSRVHLRPEPAERGGHAGSHQVHRVPAAAVAGCAAASAGLARGGSRPGVHARIGPGRVARGRGTDV